MANTFSCLNIHCVEQQLEHHRTRTFKDEYLASLKRHDGNLDDKYLLGIDADHIRRGGDGPFWLQLPRHFVPGYLHSVPSGQSACHRPVQTKLALMWAKALGYDL